MVYEEESKMVNKPVEAQKMTSEDVFNTLNERQKEIVYAIVGLAREGELDRVDTVEYFYDGNEGATYETVEEFFNHLDKKQRILVKAIIGQAIEDYESEMEG